LSKVTMISKVAFAFMMTKGEYIPFTCFQGQTQPRAVLIRHVCGTLGWGRARCNCFSSTMWECNRQYSRYYIYQAIL
jgi:hypothetical protein